MKRLPGRHVAITSFEHELQAGGGMAGRAEAGLRTVAVRIDRLAMGDRPR